MGIGLALVKALVEMHEGSVGARSEGLGRGSQFVVRLPIPEGPQTDQPTAAARMTSNQASLRLLVVDDNMDAADSLAMLLRLGLHEVQVAYTGPEALQAALNYRPDIILLDIGLPGLDGYQIAKRLRREPQTQKAVLIALTGYGQESDKEQARQAGFDHHLVKPVDPTQLQNLLALMVERESLP